MQTGGEERELVKVGEKNQSKMKPTSQIPRVTEETNRQKETSSRRGDLFLTAALSPSPSPMTKQAALMSLVRRFSQRTAAVTQHPALLKQGQEETNRETAEGKSSD